MVLDEFIALYSTVPRPLPRVLFGVVFVGMTDCSG